MTVKAYSYLRYSSGAQSEGDSLRRQLKAAYDWSTEHPDIELDTSLRDLGVSAYRGDHRVKGALASFLRRVESGDIPKGSYLLVESFDRLSRENETVAINLLTGITLAGIRVVTLTDGAEYDDKSDAMDLMRAIIVMSRAHEENKARGRKLAAAWGDKKRRARETGEILSRRGPGWTRFDPDRKKFELIPDRAAIVRRMFTEATDGLGTIAIATRFNAEGIPTFGTSAGWHPNYVLTTLHNRACIGFYQPTNWAMDAKRTARRTPDGEAIPNYFPAVVSEDLFNRVQSVIHTRNMRGKGRGRHGKTFTNLIMGLAVCEECGGRLGVHNTSSKRPETLALTCNDAARAHNCTNRAKYRCQRLEEELMFFIARVRLKQQQTTPDESELTSKLDAVAELRRRIDNLTDQVEQGVPFVADRLRQRQIELVALEKEIANLRTTIVNGSRHSGRHFGDVFIEVWDELRTADESKLYAIRAKMNALLHDRFTWIMPIKGGFYTLSGTEGLFVNYDIDGGEAQFEVPAGTQVNRRAMDALRGPMPDGWDEEDVWDGEAA